MEQGIDLLAISLFNQKKSDSQVEGRARDDEVSLVAHVTTVQA
jgi:hypothetical protein